MTNTKLITCTRCAGSGEHSDSKLKWSVTCDLCGGLGKLVDVSVETTPATKTKTSQMADEFNSITALEFLVDSRMAIIKEVIDNADDLESLMTQGVARTTANRLRDISVLETNIIEYQGK